MTKRSNRTRGVKPDRKRYDLKAKAITGGRNAQRGGIPPQAPIFIDQPEDVFLDEFGSAQFTATAESPDVPPSPILGYQWQFQRPGETFWVDATDGPQPNGTVVTGATTQTVTISNVSGNADRYKVRCSATNRWGTGYSQTAFINVTSAVYFIITETGDSVWDEPAANFVVDERSIG